MSVQAEDQAEFLRIVQYRSECIDRVLEGYGETQVAGCSRSESSGEGHCPYRCPRCRPACPGLPEPLCDHPLAQCLGGKLVPVVGCQLLTSQRGAEVGIVGANQSQNFLAYGIGQGVSGAPLFAVTTGRQSVELPQPIRSLLCHRNGLLCHRPSQNQKGAF